MSVRFSANDIGLAKENDLFADNDRMRYRSRFYSTVSGDKYLFVYGGAGAGYLFYNRGPFDLPQSGPTDGMILVGDNAESSVSKNDIVASEFAAF